MELHTFLKNVLIYVLVLGVARRVQLIPDYAQRLVDWSPATGTDLALGTRVIHDIVSSVCHSFSCLCLDRIRKDSGVLYYWNPFNIVSALHGPLGMMGNSILLGFMAVCMAGVRQKVIPIAIALGTLGYFGSQGHLVWMALPVLVSIAWMYRREQLVLAVCIGAAIVVIPATTVLGVMPMDGFRRSFETIQPTIDMHWYLMSEVFPSFREYFSRVIFIMGMLVSIGLCLKFYSKTLFLFATHGMLCTLFHPYPCSSMCAFWMTLIMVMSSDDDKKKKGTILMLFWAFCVVTVMNICAYQIWIQYNQGNANFFYGMNLLQGSVTGLVLIQALKMEHY